MSRFLTA